MLRPLWLSRVGKGHSSLLADLIMFYFVHLWKIDIILLDSLQIRETYKSRMAKTRYVLSKG